MNRLIMLVLISIMMLTAVPLAASASERVLTPGIHDTGKEINDVRKGKKDLSLQTELPEKYDTRREKWRVNIKVRDQGESGLCWACASTTAAECSYAKEIYEKEGRILTDQAAPGHTGFFLYNRVADPLGNTAGDINQPWGSTSDDWTSVGGVAAFCMQHLATWSGLGFEQNTPLKDITDNMVNPTGNNYVVKDGFKYDDAYAYDDCCILENSIYYPKAEEQQIKELVYRYGACEASIFVDGIYFTEGDPFEGYWFYNPDADSSTNHAVTVVGWDDTFPRTAFTTKSKDGTAKSPVRDGAWIVQDSYGTDSHDNGYFYVSYESSGIAGKPVVAYDMQPADSYGYNYQYDGTAADLDTSPYQMPDTVSGSSAANVFKAQSDIVLKAVGITEYNLGETDYTIDIYTGLKKADDPTSGTLACRTNCQTDTPGCKTIELSKPVGIDKGRKYSIVVNFKDKTYFGVERSNWFGFCNIEAETAPGQSFYRAGAKASWSDMNDYIFEEVRDDGITYRYTIKHCFRIKGFADDWVRDASTMTAKGKTVKVKYSGLKKKSKAVKRSKAITVKNSSGKLSYKLLSVKKAKFRKYFKVNSKTGKITIKKKLKKGKYRLRIQVADPGSLKYYPKTEKVTVTVRVR